MNDDMHSSFRAKRRLNIFRRKLHSYDDSKEWRHLYSFLAIFGLWFQELSVHSTKVRVWSCVARVHWMLLILLNVLLFAATLREVIVHQFRRESFVFMCSMVSLFAAQLSVFRKREILTKSLKQLSNLLRTMADGRKMRSMIFWLKIRFLAIAIQLVVCFLCLSRYLTGVRLLQLFQILSDDSHLKSGTIFISNSLIVIHVVLLTGFIHANALLCCFVYEKEQLLITLWRRLSKRQLSGENQSQRIDRESHFNRPEYNQEIFPSRYRTLILSMQRDHQTSHITNQIEFDFNSSCLAIGPLSSEIPNQQVHKDGDNFSRVNLGLSLSRKLKDDRGTRRDFLIKPENSRHAARSYRQDLQVSARQPRFGLKPKHDLTIHQRGHMSLGLSRYLEEDLETRRGILPMLGSHRHVIRNNLQGRVSSVQSENDIEIARDCTTKTNNFHSSARNYSQSLWLSSKPGPDLPGSGLISTLSRIAQTVKDINENLGQLSFFTVCVLLSVISTTLNDLACGCVLSQLVLGYSMFSGASNVLVFVYLVVKSANVHEEYSRAKMEVLDIIGVNSSRYFGDCRMAMDANVLLSSMESLERNFVVSCMGLFEFQKSVILTTFGCAVTYGVILMQMK